MLPAFFFKIKLLIYTPNRMPMDRARNEVPRFRLQYPTEAIYSSLKVHIAPLNVQKATASSVVSSSRMWNKNWNETEIKLFFMSSHMWNETLKQIVSAWQSCLRVFNTLKNKAARCCETEIKHCCRCSREKNKDILFQFYFMLCEPLKPPCQCKSARRRKIM